MGWKIKLIFLLIVYFSGFATAIYYLAPSDGQQCYADVTTANTTNRNSNDSSNINALLKAYCGKTYNKAQEKLSEIDWQEVKERLNEFIQKLSESVKKSQNNTEQDN